MSAWTRSLGGIACLGWLFFALTAAPAAAHELRPGYLEITETRAHRYEVRFKVPARGDRRLQLALRLPDTCFDVVNPHTEQSGAAFVDHRTVDCAGGLAGKSVFIGGLAGTFTDVVARVAAAGGGIQTARLTPDRPQFEIARMPTWSDTAETYFRLGVEHILLGFDHLSFVLALMLLIRNLAMLMKTITAFTLAHSATLAAATLGWAAAPQAPVEALIALSIAFAAAEAAHTRCERESLLRRLPWIAAFVFGLLHGFGFGGALIRIGLPQTDIPLALLTFNLGVEAGQLLFVAAVLALGAGLARVRDFRPARARAALAYGIGSVAALWFFERLTTIP